MLDPTVIEAASWKLACSIARRHPALVIRREHPGGGQYDVLAVRSDRGCQIMLNRAGTIQVHGREDGQEPNWAPTAWELVVGGGFRDVVIQLERAAGLAAVDRLPTSSAAVLVYGTLSALANLQAFSTPIEIVMGALDTSGYGAGRAAWLRDYDEIQSHVENASGPKESGFNYWQATSDRIRVAFDKTTGQAWSPSGATLNLMTTYDAKSRSFPRLLAAVLDLGATK